MDTQALVSSADIGWTLIGAALVFLYAGRFRYLVETGLTSTKNIVILTRPSSFKELKNAINAIGIAGMTVERMPDRASFSCSCAFSKRRL